MYAGDIFQFLQESSRYILFTVALKAMHGKWVHSQYYKTHSCNHPNSTHQH